MDRNSRKSDRIACFLLRGYHPSRTILAVKNDRHHG
jgi:hypothetical protein